MWEGGEQSKEDRPAGRVSFVGKKRKHQPVIWLAVSYGLRTMPQGQRPISLGFCLFLPPPHLPPHLFSPRLCLSLSVLFLLPSNSCSFHPRLSAAVSLSQGFPSASNTSWRWMTGQKDFSVMQGAGDKPHLLSVCPSFCHTQIPISLLFPMTTLLFCQGS